MRSPGSLPMTILSAPFVTVSAGPSTVVATTPSWGHRAQETVVRSGNDGEHG